MDITSKELSTIKKYGDMLPGVEIGKMEGQVEVSGEITKQEQHFIKQGEEFLYIVSYDILENGQTEIDGYIGKKESGESHRPKGQCFS